jgi:hypothetical protein
MLITMGMTHYTITGSNKITGLQVTAFIKASQNAPRVLGVTIDHYSGTLETSPLVLIEFDPDDLDSSIRTTFSFDVQCESADSNGRRIMVIDGDDKLNSMKEIDPHYVVKGEGVASRWADVTDINIQITMGEAR